MTADIIDRINAVIGCQLEDCGNPLGLSPSDHFCSQECQAKWHSARAVPLPAFSTPPTAAGGYRSAVRYAAGIATRSLAARLSQLNTSIEHLAADLRNLSTVVADVDLTDSGRRRGSSAGPVKPQLPPRTIRPGRKR